MTSDSNTSLLLVRMTSHASKQGTRVGSSPHIPMTTMMTSNSRSNRVEEVGITHGAKAAAVKAPKAAGAKAASAKAAGAKAASAKAARAKAGSADVR